MFQNIKVDIIYYKTATDFEMEFNLCGCCRMRLLTDKAPDRKTLIHNLSRAVSRSRVIFVTGALFGDDGIINTVARAVSRPLETVDEKLYGIKDCRDLKIIEGATPLVTNEGYFGGCIIESGPQAMILLSDSKSIRKYLMNKLIHPYIEELAATELRAKAEKTASNIDYSQLNGNAEIGDEQSDSVPPVLADDIVDENEPQNDAIDSETESEVSRSVEDEFAAVESKENTDKDISDDIYSFDSHESTDDGVILSGGMIFETDGSHTGSKDIPISYDSDFLLEKEEITDFADFPQDDEYSTDEKKAKKPRRSFNGGIVTLIIAVILLVTVAVLCYCIFYVPSRTGTNASAYLRETFDALFG